MNLDPLRARILEEASAESDGIFVAIFDDPTPEEQKIEREVALMAQDGLLTDLGHCQYRITSNGVRKLEDYRKNIAQKAVGKAVEAGKAFHSLYFAPIIVALIVAGILVYFGWN